MPICRRRAPVLYGYRVHGPYDPNRGRRFNPHKLLLDPYAKAIVGQRRWTDAHFGFNVASPDADLSLDSLDNACAIPRCAVIDPAFTSDTAIVSAAENHVISCRGNPRGCPLQ